MTAIDTATPPDHVADSRMGRPTGRDPLEATYLMSHWDGTLRSRIRILRIQKGMSQRQAANAGGTTRHNWHHYEKGSGHMRLDSIQMIAKALGTSASRLIEKTEYDT